MGTWELMELNNECCIGNLQLEGNNKILCGIRTRLAQKSSQNVNLVDTIQRMWVGSDPNLDVVTVNMDIPADIVKPKISLGHFHNSDDSVFHTLLFTYN